MGAKPKQKAKQAATDN